MRIGFGNDHAGVELKKELMEYLSEKGHTCIDYGAREGERVDYPVPGQMVAKEIIARNLDRGVLICGTGIGISLAANKVEGIRAAVCSEAYSAKMATLHNDAHIICMGARVVGSEVAKMIVDEFFENTFEGGRHADRVRLIMKIEQGEC